MHREHGQAAVRRILGMLSLAKKYGAARVDEAWRYLERHPQLPLSLRQVDPLSRQPTEYRDFIENKTKGE